MPILGVDGTYIPRKPKQQPKRQKKPKPYKGKRVQAMKHNRQVTEEQAKYIIDMQEAQRLRRITRED